MPKKDFHQTTTNHDQGSPPYQNEFPNRKTSCSCNHNGEEYNESLNFTNTCARSAYQRASVSVPVAVKPFSFAGPTKTYCCGEPVLKEIRCHDNCHDNDNYYDRDKCYDSNRCHYHDHCHDEVCYFVFTQEICIEVPLHFGADVSVGDSSIECHETSTEDCEDCD